MNETNCAELEGLIESDVTLSKLKRRVERHIAECPDCSENARDVLTVLSELKSLRSAYENVPYDKEPECLAEGATSSSPSKVVWFLLKAAAILAVLTFLGALTVLAILRDDHSRSGGFGTPSMTPPTTLPVMTVSIKMPSMPPRPNLSLASSPSRPDSILNQHGRSTTSIRW